MAILNGLFNEKAVEQLAWRGHMEYARALGDPIDFASLKESEREAWLNATDRILELAIWELEQKLKA